MPAASSPHRGEILQGQAIDGKAVRTASAHGERTHLVSVVEHAGAQTLGQTKRSTKRSEAHAAQEVLAGRDLSGTISSMDAGLTQRTLARQIRRQNGHYFMVVKKNHPQMYAEVVLFLSRGASWLTTSSMSAAAA